MPSNSDIFARTLVSHDINVALLGICGGIAGTIQQVSYILFILGEEKTFL